ncbi:MAG: GNAT family N-acetyltransferase [Lentisphaerae bacterium]|jgi:ribosomal protein S18 acetylase RimI-like enzyme|nr:GNAT family N-acetyltransferase [Lentisphaerota bacterium]MBT4819732.1 GNAT family N-acetyltransferase [Lentisphaerota bacterium]MBT5606618.1 GNAT family N-acetyltransferase [Lentisphaerota bacterium]MBT7059539.1 GNAT family N-acetyltransferase [Lentisphaerota bacterium]MBT7843024.1 GNAT family N-acetyltransferase [Lentisphaerota bacterium]
MDPTIRKTFPEREATLRDGRTVTVRCLRTDDAERLARMYGEIPMEDIRFYCPHPLDREHAVENAGRADAPGRVTIVAVADAEIVGYCWVRRRSPTALQGHFGICLRQSHQSCGLGGVIMKRLFEIVDAIGPSVVQLTVQPANSRAVKLYLSLGFRITRRGMRRAMHGVFPEEMQFWMERVSPRGTDLHGHPRVHVEPDAGAPGQKTFELLTRWIWDHSGLAAEERSDGADIALALNPELPLESFRISGNARGPVRIEGADRRGLIYGLGKWLRASQFAPGRIQPTTWRGDSKPVNPVRAIYFASHFHNWYHIAPLAEVERYVEELALYGCNCLSVWFDLHHYAGMEDPAAQKMVSRLRAILDAANGVGIGASLTMLCNEGFTTTPDELKATNAVQNGYHRTPGGFYNTEVCPSRPGGMELILQNREAVLQAFAGIIFDYVWIWPYDQGGCTCAECAPWGADGFVRTAKPVAELVRQHFPDAKITLSTWYFDRFVEGEWAAFHQWVDDAKPDWIDIMMIDGFRAFPEYPLTHGVPGKFPVVGFPEISMDGNGPWGGYGANPRPQHWADYWSRSGALQIGNFPYSEGIYEDINKFLMLQLNWWPERDIDNILHEYASGWFSADHADDLVQAFRLMEKDEGTRFGGITQTGEESDAPPTFRNEGGLPEAEPCESLISDIDSRLPKAIRESWRWRLIRLRALIDGELKKTGMRFNDALDDAFAELAEIYHADPRITRSCVLPPRR